MRRICVGPPDARRADAGLMSIEPGGRPWPESSGEDRDAGAPAAEDTPVTATSTLAPIRIEALRRARAEDRIGGPSDRIGLLCPPALRGLGGTHHDEVSHIWRLLPRS